MDNKINFTTDDGEEVEFAVIEEARLNGSTYLLVTEEGESDEEVAYILKEIKSGDKTEVSYVMVDDDSELAAITGLLNEVLDGEMDIVMDDSEE